MNDTDSDFPWDDIDACLYADQFMNALKRYRELTGVGMDAAMSVILERNSSLKRQFPERFKSDTDYRHQATLALAAVAGPIVVVEASWDWDSHGAFLRISAITRRASQYHPQYTEHCLYGFRGEADEIAPAIDFGKEFAASVNAPFYITDTQDMNDTKRWWDDQV